MPIDNDSSAQRMVENSRWLVDHINDCMESGALWNWDRDRDRDRDRVRDRDRDSCHHNRVMANSLAIYSSIFGFGLSPLTFKLKPLEPKVDEKGQFLLDF